MVGVEQKIVPFNFRFNKDSNGTCASGMNRKLARGGKGALPYAHNQPTKRHVGSWSENIVSLEYWLVKSCTTT